VRTLYNILFTAGFILAAPYYFWRMRRRGQWRAGFMQRFGKYDTKLKQSITNRHVLWMHAVSVGEVNVCTQLIRVLDPRLPNLKIVVSTTTTTGMGELQKKLPNHISKIYYPVDSRKATHRALSVIHPEAVVLVEAEIWPNFLWRARDIGIPTFLVNARLSDRSFRGYRRFGFLFRRIFRNFVGVGAQNEADAARLRELGCRPEAIRIVGSLKYDAARLDERRLVDVPGMFRRLSWPEDALVLVAGSTHDGEEVILADIFLKLRKRFPKFHLVLVPRHFERCRELGADLQSRGLKMVYRNEVSVSAQYSAGEVECLLVNTTGELKYFYEHASLVFVGKSLTAEGGQNPIEPGALSKPMIFGPNMQNFADIAGNFVARGGAIRVRDAGELETAIAGMLSDPAKRHAVGLAAHQVVQENLGAIERTVDMIVEHLEGGEHYIAPRPHERITKHVAR
jgi:3-deoxy-D-manno-octulosonic-acid transferase